jgi:hypothetical protein
MGAMGWIRMAKRYYCKASDWGRRSLCIRRIHLLWMSGGQYLPGVIRRRKSKRRESDEGRCCLRVKKQLSLNAAPYYSDPGSIYCK